MLLDRLSVSALKDIITGDSELSPYQSGPKLVDWFNPFGFDDEYLGGLPDNMSRGNYTLNRVNQINDNGDMKKFIESIVDFRRFIGEPELNIQRVVEAVNAIIANDEYKLENVRGVYKLYNSDNTGEVGLIAVFEDIQGAILREIQSAEFHIWIAVAWFTDQLLFDALIERRNAGIDVKIIINDDEINRQCGLNFERSFSAKRIPPDGHFNNLMHHKFCVIDLKKVIHGSYNWTKRARYNQESISITEQRGFAEEFAKTFVRLSAI